MQALAERRITPDVLVGASAGALNAAYVAGHGFTDETLTSLASIWRRLRRQDVFPFAPTRHLLALAGARPSLCAIDGLERLAVAHLPYGRLRTRQSRSTWSPPRSSPAATSCCPRATRRGR